MNRHNLPGLRRFRECSEVSYRDVLELGKWQWRTMYQQREEKLASTAEQTAKHRESLERFEWGERG
jgi:hypothetical protein